MTMDAVEKMRLWSRVEKTDPAFTKEFNKGGGFRGTSINATYLAKKATEVFGPIGLGWGVDVVEEHFIDGPLLKDGERGKLHYLRINL